MPKRTRGRAPRLEGCAVALTSVQLLFIQQKSFSSLNSRRNGPMGISKELFINTYQLYKSYTNDICRWLVSASDFKGNDEPLQAKPSEPPKTQPVVRAPRLKGKARKLAKSTPSGSSAGTKPGPTTSVPKSEQSKTKVTGVDQMIEMAEKISLNPESVPVPRSILVKLEKTISLRSQFLQLYAVKLTTDGADEDLARRHYQHVYFVRVLERVLAILKPSQPSKPNAEDAPESDSAESSKTSKIAQTINNFHVLDIDEVEEEDGDADTTPPLVFPTKPTQNHKPTREEMLPEILFATFCFFSDLDALKYSLCDHWKQYRERKISLDTVTLMTNMGIAVSHLISTLWRCSCLTWFRFKIFCQAIQRAEEQFIETFADYLPANPSYFDIAPPLFHTLFKDFTDDRLNPDGYTYNFRGEELLRLKYVDDLMCRTTASTLTTRALSSEFCKLDKDDDWCLDRSKMPFSAIVGINREILNHITAECDVLESMGFDYGQDDPLTHGLRKLCRSQFKIPISIGLVFSAQMVICANSILGTAGTRPFEDMQAAARRADALISKYEEAGLHQADRTSPETSGVVQSFVDLIRNFMLDDAIAKMKVEVLSKFQHNAKATLPTRPFHFFKFNPLACGNRLLALEVFLKGWSAPTAQNYLTCIQTAHLYHMFRLMTPLDVRWPEMDSFLSLHSTDALFAGKVPTTMAECLTRSVDYTVRFPSISVTRLPLISVAL